VKSTVMFSVVDTEPPVAASGPKTRRDQGFRHGAAIGPDYGGLNSLLAIGAIPARSCIEVAQAIRAGCGWRVAGVHHASAIEAARYSRGSFPNPDPGGLSPSMPDLKVGFSSGTRSFSTVSLDLK